MDVKIRRLVKEVIIRRKNAKWMDSPSSVTSTKEVIQYLDPKEGWKDIPVEYDTAFMKED